MSFVVVLLCLSIIAFTLVSTAGAVLSTLLHRYLAERLEALPARRRGDAYLLLRLTPTLCGALFVGVFLVPSFLLFEPPGAGDEASIAVIGLALLAALPLLRGATAGLSTWRSTRRRVARWLVDAEPLGSAGSRAHPIYLVKTPFPVVAVVGIRRPFLVVSRAVLDACSEIELAAILAHEATHVRRRDNLKRLLMLIAPDALVGTATARDLELKWQRATEEVADEGAGRRRALDLAAALIKVARLGQGLAAPPVATAAFCRDGDISRRVVRLTGDHHAGGGSIHTGALLAAAGLVTFVTLSLAAGALPRVHALAEAAVTFLQ